MAGCDHLKRAVTRASGLFHRNRPLVVSKGLLTSCAILLMTSLIRWLIQWGMPKAYLILSNQDALKEIKPSALLHRIIDSIHPISKESAECFDKRLYRFFSSTFSLKTPGF